MGAPKDNKFALGNNGGRPPVFATPEDLENKCIEYFEHCTTEKEKTTITGLALFLGFCDRASIADYVKKDEFSHIIKRAKLAVEYGYEKSGSTIDIFALKQMGWEDKKAIDHSGQIKGDSHDLSNLDNDEIIAFGKLNKKIKGL